MPRTTQSPAARIVSYFRDAPIEVATLVLDLCGDAVRARKAKTEKIREGQRRAAGVSGSTAGSVNGKAEAATKSAVSHKVAKPKQRRRRRRKSVEAAPADALPPQATDEELDLEFGDTAQSAHP